MFVLKRLRELAKFDGTALINGTESLSFSEMDERSENFGRFLRTRLNGDSSPILIYGHKETDFLPCIYGSLKAGHAYVPVDISVPSERVREIIEDISPKIIVDFSRKLTANAEIILPEDLTMILSSKYDVVISESDWVEGENTAYILFTSGSSGKPKGVPITAQNLESFCVGLLKFMGNPGNGGVMLNQISYSFDVSCCAVYVGMGLGMTLYTIDNAITSEPRVLFAHLRQSGLTMWVSTPSFGELCMQYGAFDCELLSSLTDFLFCGEVLTHKLCDQLFERFPDSRICNTYGPTEATVLVTAVNVTADMRADVRSIPIGYPIDGVTLRLIDGDGETVVEDKVAGELLIIGDSVGTGYYRRSELTAERFFQDKSTGKRGYRTGDICFRENGLYYYQGRIDNQLKLHGHRIELEDIEQNLSRQENIVRAVVVPVWEEEKVSYLAAFVLLTEPDGLTPLKRSVAVKKKAAETLPDYMIPRKIIAVESFPVNSNGKVDKKALSESLRGTSR